MPKKLHLSLLISCIMLTACSSHTAANAQQSFSLGQQYYRAQNYGDAFTEISKAAKQGNINAQYALGYMYYNGIGTENDTAKGIYWIKQAATKGQPQAINALQLLRNNHTVSSITP